MHPKHLERWSCVRQKGLLRYVLVNGVLMYGLPLFVVMTFFVHRDKLATAFVAMSALLWAIGGVAFGLLTWWWWERRYRAALQREHA